MDDDRTLFKQLFDLVEGAVSPPLDRLVRSDEFADVTATWVRREQQIRRNAPKPNWPDLGQFAPAAVARSVARSMGPVVEGLAARASGPEAIDPSRWLPEPLAEKVRLETDRAVRRMRNGIAYLADDNPPLVAQTPRDLVWQNGKVCLYRYRSEQRRYRTPLLLVMSLVSKAYIFDLRPGSSFVEVLLDSGLDVYMLDWGVPDAAESQQTLELYCDQLLPDAVAQVVADSGSADLSLLGYCLGGVLTLLYAAAHLDAPIANLAVVATPVDFHKVGPMASMLRRGRLDVDDLLDETGNVPPEVLLQSFRMLDPLGDLSGLVGLLDRLWDDGHVLAYRTVTEWAHDQIPFPGALLRQLVRLFNRDNGFINDTVVYGGRRVSIADISCPVLCVQAERDHITPAESSDVLVDLVGSADTTKMSLPAGHVGIITGRRARTETMPAMAAWFVERSAPLTRRRTRPPKSGQAKAPSAARRPRRTS